MAANQRRIRKIRRLKEVWVILLACQLMKINVLQEYISVGDVMTQKGGNPGAREGDERAAPGAACGHS